MLSAFWGQFVESLEKKDEKIPFLYSLLKQLTPVELTDKKIVLGCSNQGLKFFLEKRSKEVTEVFSSFTQKRLAVEFIIKNHKRKVLETPLLSFKPSVNDLFLKTGLHQRHGFDNFAVSGTNQVAYAASQAVVNNLGHAYNPLFLWGGVGVGKTHLLYSIGRSSLEGDGERKIFFCPSDQFTNELIESIREKTTPKFRRKYRHLSLLMIDDIQFIAGKQAVQEEFFHTFNSVVSSGGQVVLTSDRPPSEIKNLEDRLRSRFSGGLIIDIQPPDFELRTAILLIKAREKNIELDIEAAKIIAGHVDDTRALEGTLLSLYTKTLGGKERIDVALAKEHVEKKRVEKVRKISPVDIIRTVCSFYNVRVSHLKGESRTSNIVLPRQVAMFILRNLLKLRLEEVASLLKRKDHTTVMHATEKINRLLIKDSLFKKEVDQILASLELST